VTTDLYYFYLDAVPPIRIVFSSCSRRRASVSKWRQVPLNGVIIIVEVCGGKYLANKSYRSKKYTYNYPATANAYVRYFYRNLSVRLSVCPSVCQMRAL